MAKSDTSMRSAATLIGQEHDLPMKRKKEYKDKADIDHQGEEQK